MYAYKCTYYIYVYIYIYIYIFIYIYIYIYVHINFLLRNIDYFKFKFFILYIDRSRYIL